ncbi:hypothetical protein K466DRAFT_661106 [Polyporus arcularius HHB13444]|uniref:Telomere replication protein EST3 n=1 Tax=Polyporus arcularius HHB13444 TaxID=1314778 RepID=A0A5C3PP54_9APHY|nr:hypothetical protein K466DRAFT_661106 [Polyporus arcularius HHB13444]
MSDTIPSPWIVNFLVSVAEEYGGNLSVAPPKAKGAKAQLVKFLTFPDPGDTAPCNIWVEISDKKHIIHARLSQDAMTRYLQHPLYGGKPITSHKSALVSLQRVRVAFGRVPNRESKGMTKDATLFLDVEEFELKGAFGEAMWGSPVDITSDKNIRDWTNGLRQDGGAGNVLKQRKAQASSVADLAKKARTTASEPHIQTTVDGMNVKVRVARKSGPRVSSGAKDTAYERPPVSKEALRKATWKRFHAKVVKYFCPPDEVLEHLFTLCGGQLPPSAVHRGSLKRPGSHGSRSPRGRTRLSVRPSASMSASPDQHGTSPVRTPQSSPPRSPSNWSPSIRGSPRRSNKGLSDTEEEQEDAVSGIDTDSDNAADEHAVHNTSSTKLGTQSPKSPKATMDQEPLSLSMPPPPAQPRSRLPPSSVPYATSSPRPSVRAQDQSRANVEHAESLPPSSLPAPVSSLRFPPSPASSPHLPASTPRWSTSGLRRVPLPQVGMLLRDPDSSGEGRVLVENSDTASPGSQRIVSSQSQSQSQGTQEHGQSSQSQRSSKLRNEVGAAETDAEEDPRKSMRSESRADAEAPAAPELEEESQESAKSRQSLSYKGDSQSQDKPGVLQQAPETEMQVTAEAEEHEPAMGMNDVDEVPDVGTEGAGDGEDGGPRREPSPRASSMSVDPRRPAGQDAPHAAEPSWAAIRATSSSEDGDDSEGDVDELLSDPLGFQQEARAPPRQTRGRKAKGHAVTTETGRLDSDDERTAALVHQYVSQTKQAAHNPRRSGGRQSSPAKRPRQSTPVFEEQPQHRAMKRRKREDDGQQASPSLPPAVDVLTDEDSFREEKPERSSELETHERVPLASSREEKHQSAAPRTGQRSDGAGSKVLAHDPSVWAIPTFMRKPDGPKRSAFKAGGPAADAGKAAASRKRTAGPSLSTEEEQPAAKKRKTSAAVVPVAGPANVVANDTSASRKPTTSLTSSTTAHLQARNVTADSSSTLNRSLAVPPQENGSKGVKYVDLRAVSRPTSRSSSRASRAGSGIPHPAQVAHGLAVSASASSKGKAPVRSVKHEEADSLRPSQVPPVLSGAKSVSSRNATDSSTSVSRHASLLHASISASGSGTRGTPDDGVDATRRLVNEYRASLQQTRTPGGPPFLGWHDLAEILLETGRARKEIERTNGR